MWVTKGLSVLLPMWSLFLFAALGTLSVTSSQLWLRLVFLVLAMMNGGVAVVLARSAIAMARMRKRERRYRFKVY